MIGHSRVPRGDLAKRHPRLPCLAGAPLPGVATAGSGERPRIGGAAPVRGGRFTRGGLPHDDQHARAAADRVLGRLQRLGTHVVIDAPLPLFKAGVYCCSDWFNRRNPACAGGLDMPRADLERLRAPQMALLAHLAARYPSLKVWDPLPLLCRPQTCSAVEDGQPLFFDPRPVRS